jgi:DNA-binding beta-propeller fold protein YncE
MALDPSTGLRLGYVTLKSRPEGLVLSPDGARVVVLEPGTSEDKRERGRKARTRSAVTVIDAAGMTALGRVELGNGLDVGSAYFGAGRVALFCPGYDAKDAAEAQPRELVVVDLQEGREAGRVRLEHGVVPVGISGDGRTLALVQGLPRLSRRPFATSRVWFVDMVAATLLGSVETGPLASIYSDGSWLYLLDPGQPDADSRRSRNGVVQVVSLESHLVVASHDAGRKPHGFAAEAGVPGVVVASDGPPGRLDGELRAIRGASVAVSAGVAANPGLVVRDRGRAIVVGAAAVTLADAETAAVRATLPLKRGAERLVFDDEVPLEALVSGDGRRAFVLYEPGSKLAALDLAAERPALVGVARTGRGSRRLMRGLGLAAGALSLVPGGVGEWANAVGLVTAPGLGSPAARPGAPLLALRPDGRYAYALNVGTGDVTAVDADTATASYHVPAPGLRLRPLAGGATLAVLAPGSVQLIDTTRHRRIAEIELPGLSDVVASPDGRHALVLADRKVLCLDGATGDVVATVTNFVQPTVVAFDVQPPAP